MIREGKNNMSIAELIEKAAKKDPDAMWELGEAYYWGNGVEENDEKAFSLYQELEALRPEDPDLLNRLGKCFTNGFGTQIDVNKGIQYFQKAAGRNSANACFNLGEIFRNGEIINQNIPLAIEYLEKAVGLNNDDAMVMLGDMYHEGEGVEQNEEKACELYSKASVVNNSNACYRMGVQAYNGLGVTQDHQKAIEYWEKGADDHWGCQLMLGTVYKDGIDVPRDMEKSLYWFKKSADRGLRDAHIELGKIYIHGFDNVPADEEQAIQHLTIAAEDESIDAMVMLGDYYFGKKNMDEAAKWFEKAADRNNSLYIVLMARMTRTIMAHSGMIVARQVDFGYDFTREEWEKAYSYSKRVISIIQEGKPRQNEIDLYNNVSKTLEKDHQNIIYGLATCYFMIKRNNDALNILDGCTTIEGRILYAVAYFAEAEEEKFGEAYKYLSIIDNLGEYYYADKNYEEEQILSIGAYMLAGIYRLGLPGICQPNVEKAYTLLSKVKQILKEKDHQDYLQKEMNHYKKKIFGGFTYN